MASARKALLVKSDLPKGWTSSPSSDANTAIPGEDQLASCLGVPASVITRNPPTANSPRFESSDKLDQVNDSVSVYPSKKAAEANFSAAANPKAPQCLTTLLNGAAKSALVSGLGPGATVGTIQMTRARASEFAPHSAAFMAFLPVTEQGQTVNVQLTEVVYVKGDEDQTLTLTATQVPFPATLAHRLTTIAAGRL